MITVLDYGAGNVRSVINAIEHIGETVRWSPPPKTSWPPKSLFSPV